MDKHCAEATKTAKYGSMSLLRCLWTARRDGGCAAWHELRKMAIHRGQEQEKAMTTQHEGMQIPV